MREEPAQAITRSTANVSGRALWQVVLLGRSRRHRRGPMSAAHVNNLLEIKGDFFPWPTNACAGHSCSVTTQGPICCSATDVRWVADSIGGGKCL
jgi:hypothetical protein